MPEPLDYATPRQPSSLLSFGSVSLGITSVWIVLLTLGLVGGRVLGGELYLLGLVLGGMSTLILAPLAFLVALAGLWERDRDRGRVLVYLGIAINGCMLLVLAARIVGGIL